MIQVNWDQPELRQISYRNRPHKREAYYPCTCGACQRVYWLRASDARRAEERGSTCGRCQRRAAGRRGYAVTRERYGERRALEYVADYQRAHLSKPELKVRRWLDSQLVMYQDQFIFQTDGFNAIIDFVIGSLAIEVNGWWHQRNHGDRDARLSAVWPGTVLFIDAEAVMNNPAPVWALLTEALTYNDPSHSPRPPTP